MIAPQGSNIHGPPPFALGLRARVDAFRTYKTMRWWPCLLLFPSLARAQEPVVAVFDLEDTKGVVTAQDRVALGKIIANTLAVSRQFKLVPSQQVRQALIEKKRESYRSCYDESCQIEIGKELAASHSLGCSLQRLGSQCDILLTLYDLRESVSVGGAKKTGGCTPEALARLAEAVASELVGAKTPRARDEASRLPTTDYEALVAEAEAARREQEAKLKGEEAAREEAQAKRLLRLDQAWSAVVKVASTAALERERRIGAVEQFLGDFADDNPRDGDAKALLAVLKAGKEPAGGASGGMVWVPGGPFYMGCNPQVDDECRGDEKPGRTVQMPSFRVDETEVTLMAYTACVKAGKCTAPSSGGACNWAKSDRGKHPINCVDWNQATAYCAWVKKRLPTEAEWEKAARGAEGRKYPWGNQFEATKANLGRSDDGFEETAPVGSFVTGASPYGALDMIGNVREWVSNRQKTGEYRSFRGGGWNDVPRHARASGRVRYVPGSRVDDIGFRCAQSELSDSALPGEETGGEFRTLAAEEKRPGLRDSDILGVLRKQRNDIRGCLEKQASTDPSLEGTMTVEILVQSSGIPSQITTGPDKFKNSVVSECVVTAVRNWKFPTFSGRAMNIDFPVLVRAQ